MCNWTPETEAELTRLWLEGRSLTFIGKAMGVSRGKIAGKRKRMGLPTRIYPTTERAKPWTYQEYDFACRLRDEDGLSFRAIGLVLGRPLESVRDKVNLGFRQNIPGVHELPVKAPEFVIRERDYRYSINHSSITAALLGDPPPGYSALDRKRSMEAA